ncbi:unnamed protein product [Cylindrotheca closterium]|uniref:Uncharacterized protein n=1 Tax=Cylindrotheca closterium TaxID=2856 RepID=A0AAD2FJW2_9STRA|nr:unnamed protein product [Cylindrotheca closterium]
MDNADPEMNFRKLSQGQELLLAILPIPSAILSMFGSVIIITMAFHSRQKKPWTPYHGLLTGMSLCDILFSITLAAGNFLYPKSTSDRALAMGNDATCDAIGFFNQFSYSALLYNAMLGYYFLLTTKYRYSNMDIAAKFETSMHMVCLGWPLLTAFAGLFMDVYGEREVNIGCWVRKDIPYNCGKGPDKTGEPCKSFLYGNVFGGIILFVCLCSLVITNIVIWTYVRKQVNHHDQRLSRLQKQQTPATIVNFEESSEENENAAPARPTKEQRLAEIQEQQHKRLMFLRFQAMLFVGGFAFCNFATYLLRILESRAESNFQVKELPYRFFFLLLLQAITFPLQGFINMFVYMRPTYLSNRKSHPSESKLWCYRRAILGDSVEPLHSDTRPKIHSLPVQSFRKLDKSIIGNKNGTNIVATSTGDGVSSTASVPPEVDPNQVKEVVWTPIELDEQDDARATMVKKSLAQKNTDASAVMMDGTIQSTGYDRPQ